MSDLTQEHCEACRADAPKVSATERESLMSQIPGWHLETQDGIEQLARKYSFPNFVTALNFTNSVGEIAESEGHHPALLTEWGSVTVRWWSHKIKGLHRNDFIMAARCDTLAGTL